MATRVGIALGSNLGDSLGQIKSARDMLRELAADDAPFLQAPIYRSEPLDCPAGSPDFLNTVIEIAYAASPHELLKQTRQTESRLGRAHVARKNAPRTIDIDILYLGDAVLNDDDLVIPHPEMTRRRFVLQPLADIRPELVLPGGVHTISELLHQLDSGRQPLTVVHSEW